MCVAKRKQGTEARSRAGMRKQPRNGRGTVNGRACNRVAAVTQPHGGDSTNAKTDSSQETTVGEPEIHSCTHGRRKTDNMRKQWNTHATHGRQRAVDYFHAHNPAPTGQETRQRTPPGGITGRNLTLQKNEK